MLKYFFCQFGLGKGLVLYGVEDLGENVRIFLSDHKGKSVGQHDITVPMLKGIEGNLPLSVQITKYKDCAVICEHSNL